MFHTHHTTTADTPIIVTALLEEADRIILEAEDQAAGGWSK